MAGMAYIGRAGRQALLLLDLSDGIALRYSIKEYLLSVSIYCGIMKESEESR